MVSKEEFIKQLEKLTTMELLILERRVTEILIKRGAEWDDMEA